MTSVIGSQARFDVLAGFIQLNRSVAIVADAGNDCLRAVNLETGQTSRYAGRCTVRGDSDGELVSEARFNTPWSVVLHKYNLYITDTNNNAIKVIKEGHDHVVTVAQGGVIRSPTGITVDQFSSNDIAYITTTDGLLKLDLNIRTATKLTDRTAVPGPLSAIRSSPLVGLSDLAFVTDTILIIADNYKNQLIVADLARDKVTYICDGKPGTANGDIKTCGLNRPISVLAMSWSIYIGERGFIRRLPLKAIQGFIQPADAIG